MLDHLRPSFCHHSVVATKFSLWEKCATSHIPHSAVISRAVFCGQARTRLWGEGTILASQITKSLPSKLRNWSPNIAYRPHGDLRDLEAPGAFRQKERSPKFLQL